MWSAINGKKSTKNYLFKEHLLNAGDKK